MNLHPQVLQTLQDRGLSEQEVGVLEERMMYAVNTLQSQITAITAQIDALTQQRVTLMGELENAQATVAKLLADEPPAEPAA